MVGESRDIDPEETREWLDALASVLEHEGSDRAQYLLERLLAHGLIRGLHPPGLNTPYLNTLTREQEAQRPGDPWMERRLRSLIRWNALAMVMRANDNQDELGGHIATFASSATLYDIGFNHFFRAPKDDFAGDLLYVQGHSSPGIYARSFLEGRISEKQLENFRREVGGKGLSSYPHPWLMRDYWQFPTVSMGLGPIMAIYQAHFLKYLINRGLLAEQGRRVWAFLGDGEMDEPESLGALALAGRERLDNLTFVVNCNLQRLDGPVRGNGKIIQELESVFRGAGWNVIKIVWGGGWDALLEKDKSGLLLQRMQECVDGEYQAYSMHGGAYTRAHFFGKYPELLELVSGMSDEEIYQLKRGGHDPQKVYAAYHAAVHHQGQPTVILAKTVKGYGTGHAESVNKTHQIKHLDLESLKVFRDRFAMPFDDDTLAKVPFYRPAEDSPELRYLQERRQALGGYLPQRRHTSPLLPIPDDVELAPMFAAIDRPISTTMAFVRLLNILLKKEGLGDRIVPIVPDEARTFGMEGLFRQRGIYSNVGQLYEPEDRSQVMYYREDVRGQILQEGINEAGAMSAWIAAATSYSVNQLPMVPFYIYYAMFGFQRVGDLAWAAGDSQARGFLLGATSGRTALNGEGLQHQDGHSPILASTVPNCIAYDPAYAYEVAVIIRDGLRRMYQEQESVYFYLTLANENLMHPAMPDGVEEGILRGLYRVRTAETGSRRVQILAAGVMLPEALLAAEILRDAFAVQAQVYSVTSFNELRRDGLEVDRFNMLHPSDPPRIPWVTQQLRGQKAAVVGVSDFMKIHADQIRAWVPDVYHVLGTDGFGRSDTRERLREHFE
ncbi:MAG: pyruvate dehydrogenase (acetyl-transferring), homodimeric type, partial [Pseudomonadales bacterium]|nr:pyruvate dehydrogenase (acetyl-transferring), homodimeric type [Pseudomonadales bacterium]